MKTNKTNTEWELLENNVIFIPLEEIRNIESVVEKLETIRRELQKVAEGMKPIETEWS
jgi:hypothetical protein